MNFKKIVKPYEPLLFKSLKELVAIPSVYDKKTASKLYPYGKNVDLALNAFAKIGKNNGFKVEKDPHYVELSYGKKGPLIEIFGHLDVVPIGKIKGRNPFSLTKKGNKLFARGVADDKGPLLAAFYALKAIKDANLIKNCRVKVFAGGDEERGSSCLEYYVNNKHKETPKYGFTPDSKFPLIYGEKGSANIKIKIPIKLKHIISIKGGLAPNVVIANATFKVDNLNKIKNKIKVPFKANKNEITFLGVPTHGSTPNLGKNAFLIGLMELGKINNDKSAIKLVNIFLDYLGKKLNAYAYSKDLKNTTYSIGIVNYQNGILKLTINFRYPEVISPKTLTKRVLKTLNATLINETYSKPLLYSKDLPLIKALLNAYHAETKDLSNAITTGGGTYAKDVKNTVAFGAEFKNKNYHMHDDDEFIEKEDLIKAMQIYAHAIYNLIKLNEN